MRESIKKRIEAVRHGEVPEGYRRTKDLGIAPSDWRVGQLSDVLHNEQRPVPKPDEPYWRLGIRSWAKGTFHAYVDDPAAVDMDELYVVQENDLVVNITFAWEHAIAVASKEDDGLLVSHRFPTYTFDGGNVPEYYKAVVSQQYFRDMLDHISPGGAGRNRVLNRKDFLALPCHIPPIAEQQKIAEILATCDRVIELKQQLLEEKRRQKQWLMQKLLDPKSGVRLPEFKDREWIDTPLSSLCEFAGGGTPDTSNEQYWNGTIPWISSADLKENNIYSIEITRHISEEAVRCSAAKICPQNSILIVSRVGVGKIAIAPVDLCTSQDFTNLVNVKGNLYFIALQLQQAIQRILSMSQGTSIKGITSKEVKAIEISLPSRDEQDAIARVLECSDREISLCEQEIETWHQKKKALMQLLLTGLVRVNA